MAEGKTITIVQKGKTVNEITVTLNCYAVDAYKTCFIITPKVNGSTLNDIRAEASGSRPTVMRFTVTKGSSVQLTGKSHYCENGQCRKADGTVIMNCFDALADNYVNARFDGLTTASFTANSNKEISVTWT